MGMDVSGKNGQDFRANCWYWRPLWDYCYKVAPHIIDEKTYKACQYNDGKGLDAVKSNKLGMFLLNELASGRTDKYKIQRDKYLSTLPDRECLACKGTGVLIISYNEKGSSECKTCNGFGLKDNWEKSYIFDTKVVAEWAEFLTDCDGFEVW